MPARVTQARAALNEADSTVSLELVAIPGFFRALISVDDAP
jgi:hypothetical protein